MINCITLNIEPKCIFCSRSDEDETECDVSWFKNQIKLETEEGNVDIKQSIMEWVKEISTHSSTTTLFYLTKTIENFWPEQINYLNTILLLK